MLETLGLQDLDKQIADIVESDVFQAVIYVIVAYIVLIWLASAFWAYRDMRLRSASAITPVRGGAFHRRLHPGLLPLRPAGLPHRAAQGDHRRGERTRPGRRGDAGRGRFPRSLRQLLATGPRGVDHLPHLPQPTASRLPQLRAPHRARLDAVRLVRQGLRASRGSGDDRIHALRPSDAATTAAATTAAAAPATAAEAGTAHASAAACPGPEPRGVRARRTAVQRSVGVEPAAPELSGTFESAAADAAAGRTIARTAQLGRVGVELSFVVGRNAADHREARTRSVTAPDLTGHHAVPIRSWTPTARPPRRRDHPAAASSRSRDVAHLGSIWPRGSSRVSASGLFFIGALASSATRRWCCSRWAHSS